MVYRTSNYCDWWFHFFKFFLFIWFFVSFFPFGSFDSIWFDPSVESINRSVERSIDRALLIFSIIIIAERSCRPQKCLLMNDKITDTIQRSIICKGSIIEFPTFEKFHSNDKQRHNFLLFLVRFTVSTATISVIRSRVCGCACRRVSVPLHKNIQTEKVVIHFYRLHEMHF